MNFKYDLFRPEEIKISKMGLLVLIWDKIGTLFSQYRAVGLKHNSV